MLLVAATKRPIASYWLLHNGPFRDEPEAGHVRSGPAGPDVRVRSGPADFRPDLSRICRSFFTHFNPLFYDILGFQAWVLVLRQYQG